MKTITQYFIPLIHLLLFLTFTLVAQGISEAQPPAGQQISGSYLHWRFQVWGETTSSESDLYSDPDQDGIPNGMEFIMGSDPLSADNQSFHGFKWNKDKNAWAFWWRSVDDALRGNLHAEFLPNFKSAQEHWSGIPKESVSSSAVSFKESLNEILLPVSIEPNNTGAFRLAAEVNENPSVSDVPKWVWFEAEGQFGGESHPVLSNEHMTWLSPDTNLTKTGIDIPADGTYTLWIRKFWTGYPLRWRLRGQDWVEVSASTPTQDLMEIDEPSRRVGWIQAGQVTVDQGTYAFDLQVTNSSWAAFDAFLLTQESFTPRGAAKPDEQTNTPPEGWSAFVAENDPFSYSPIDLSKMNQDFAGQDGFIKAEGDRMVFSETGEPVRFWGVNVSASHSELSPESLGYLARSLAKRGVNLVRFHSPIYQTSGTSGLLTPDLNRIRKIQRLIQIFSREGIYTGLSIYFPLWVNIPPNHPEFPGYTSSVTHPFGLPYFQPDFQMKLRNVWTTLLTTPDEENGGLTLAENPAVAYLEMINEDSLFFWTTDDIPLPQRQILEEQFASWVIEQYGSIGGRTRQWNSTHSRDNLPAGRLGIRTTWELFNNRDLRSQDTVRFLSQTQRKYYDTTRDFLKNDLGYAGMICGSNWKTGSAQYLDPIEQWTNAGADFLDQHGYFGGLHTGENSSWSVQKGQRYDDRTALSMQNAEGTSRSASNPLMNPQYAGKPSMISEINWPTPNRFRGEMPVLGAAYASLQGTDALGWFALATSPWETLPAKFSLSTPGILGQFPVAAMIYRNNWIQETERVVDLDLSLESLWRLEGAPLPTPQNYDQLRGDEIPPGGVIPNTDAIDELAFWVGKTHADFITDETEPDSKILDLGSRIRRSENQVLSLNQQLVWDWDESLVTLNSEHAQGWIGFLTAANAQELPDFQLQAEFEFGSIVIVSMDQNPIPTAEKILIQVFSEEMPYSWETNPENTSGQPRTIIETGESPLMIRNTPGVLAWKRGRADQYQYTPLDWNGYRVTEPKPVGASGTIPLPPAGGFIWIERQ